MPKITNKLIESVKPNDREQWYWDNELKGFGARIYPSGQVVFLLQYRFNHRNRRKTLGKYPIRSANEARKLALKALAKLADGVDPNESEQSWRAMTVSELCDLYLDEGVDFKKPSTISTDIGRIGAHIKPLLGDRILGEVTRQDVERFQSDVAKGRSGVNRKNPKKHSRTRVRGGKGTANRTLGLLGGILSFAVNRGLIEKNPVHGVRKFPDQKRDRVLSPDEWARSGHALMSHPKVNPTRRNAILFLIVSGCRRGEVQGLKWSDVDVEHRVLRLKDSKTGAKVIPLGDAAIDILNEMPREKDCPYVFPGKGGVQMTDLSKTWNMICDEAGIEDCRLHDLRHQFATIGVTRGEGDRLYVVSQILGHKDSKTTQRYAHLQQQHLQNAASDIGSHIIKLMEGDSDAGTVR